MKIKEKLYNEIVNITFFYKYSGPFVLALLISMINLSFWKPLKDKSFFLWIILNIFFNGFFFFPWVWSWPFVITIVIGMIFIGIVKFQYPYIPGSHSIIIQRFTRIFIGLMVGLFLIIDLSLVINYFFKSYLLVFYQYLLPCIPAIIWCILMVTIKSFFYLMYPPIKNLRKYQCFIISLINMGSYLILLNKISLITINIFTIGWATVLAMMATLISFNDKSHGSIKNLIRTSSIALSIFIINFIMTLMLLMIGHI